MWHLQSMNRLKLQPILHRAVALDTGTLVHQTIASWIYEPKEDPTKFFMYHSDRMLEKAKADYYAIVGVKANDDELDVIYESIELGSFIIKNYYERWKRPLPRHMVMAAAEQEVVVPIPGTEHECLDCNGSGYRIDIQFGEARLLDCEICSGTGIEFHFLKCTFDGLIQNEEGNLFILEHKTYGKRPNMKFLERNNQFCGYIWAAQQLGIGNVIGLAYDGMLKKKYPTTYNGKKETLVDLFIRKVLERPQVEIDEWARFTANTVIEMAAMPHDVKDPRLTFYRRWEGCYDCQVEKVCTAISLDEDYEYVINHNYTQRVIDEPLGVADGD